MFPVFRKKYLPLLVFLLICAVYLFLLTPLTVSDGLWVNDEGNRLLHIEAFAKNGGYIRDPLAGAMVPGVTPFADGGYFVREPDSGKVISAYTDAFPFLFSYVYRLGGYPLCRTLVIFLALGTVALTGYLLRLCRLDSFRIAGGMLLTGLGTPLLFYSGMLQEFSLAALLTAVMFFLIKKDSLLYWGLAGVTASLIPWFREEGYFIFGTAFLVLLIFRCREWKTYLTFGAAAVPGILALFIYNFVKSTSFLGLHYMVYQNIRPAVSTLPDRLESFYFFLFQPNFSGLGGAVCGAVCLFLTVFDFAGTKKGNHGVELADTPIRDQIRAGLLWTLALIALLNTYFLVIMPDPVENSLSYQSLCATVPFFLIPFLFARSFLQDPDFFRKMLFFTAAVSALVVAFLLEYCNRGIFFGPRYHNLLLPLFAVLAMMSFDYAKKSKVLVSAMILICLCAAVCQFYGFSLLKERKEFGHSLNQLCREQKVPLVITDVFFVPEELAAQNPDETAVLFVSDEGLIPLKKMTEVTGADRFLFVTNERYHAASRLPDVFSSGWNIRLVRILSSPRLNFMTLHIFLLERKK